MPLLKCKEKRCTDVWEELIGLGGFSLLSINYKVKTYDINISHQDHAGSGVVLCMVAVA